METNYKIPVIAHYSAERVAELKKMIDDRGVKVDIEVDGGVTLDNVEKLLDAGANIIVAGSAVFTGELTENVTRFLNILHS